MALNRKGLPSSIEESGVEIPSKMDTKESGGRKEFVLWRWLFFHLGIS